MSADDVFGTHIVKSRLMESGRNWPAALGVEPTVPADPLTKAVEKVLTDGAHFTGLEPSAAAQAVVEGILNDRFVVTTHPAELTTAAAMRLDAARDGTLQSRTASTDR
jgi:hypothetical protein